MLDYRSQLPTVLPGIGAFDRSARELDQASLIRLIKACPLFDELRARTSYEHDGVRERMDGEWGLAYLAFTNSMVNDIRPWWRDSNTEVWWEAGFTGRPDYEIVYKRFRELDEAGASHEFFEASAKLIRLAHVCSGGLIGLDAIIDFTEAESHASIKHDCQKGECPGLPANFKARRRGNARYARASVDAVREDRQERSRRLPEDEDAPNIGDAQTMVYDRRRDVVRIKVNGHWYRLSDKTAGARAYSGPRKGAKFWLGFYNGKAADRCSGLPLTMVVDSASEQEYNIYPRLVERVLYILGAVRSVRGDMGLGINKVYLHNSQRGIFSVIPPKGRPREPEPADHERVDRHGVERCENCGGPTERISFAAQPKPRVFFKCKLAPYPECRGKQSLLCETNPRRLLPLRQDTELYQALETKTFQYERVHRHARQRNGSGADNATLRPKRRGVGWQQLRADATVFSDWLKACFRQGWLPIPGTVIHNRHEPVEVSGKAGLEGLQTRRVELGLHRPYGYRARRLGLGPVRVPQPDGVELSIPDIDAPPPTKGQRNAKGGRPRPQTELPETIPPLPDWAAELEQAADSEDEDSGTDTPGKRKGAKRTGKQAGAPKPSATTPLSAAQRQARRSRAGWAKRAGAAPAPTDPSDPRSPPASGAGPPDSDDVPF